MENASTAWPKKLKNKENSYVLLANVLEVVLSFISIVWLNGMRTKSKKIKCKVQHYITLIIFFVKSVKNNILNLSKKEKKLMK